MLHEIVAFKNNYALKGNDAIWNIYLVILLSEIVNAKYIVGIGKNYCYLLIFIYLFGGGGIVVAGDVDVRMYQCI